MEHRSRDEHQKKPPNPVSYHFIARLVTAALSGPDPLFERLSGDNDTFEPVNIVIRHMSLFFFLSFLSLPILSIVFFICYYSQNTLQSSKIKLAVLQFFLMGKVNQNFNVSSILFAWKNAIFSSMEK